MIHRTGLFLQHEMKRESPDGAVSVLGTAERSKMNLNDNIRRLRQKKGLTQEQLAALMNNSDKSLLFRCLNQGVYILDNKIIFDGKQGRKMI